MKNYGNFLRTMGIILILSLGSSCDKEQQGDAHYELPTFKKVYENLVKDNLELPSGLSSGQNLEKSSSKGILGLSAEIEGIFVEAPIFVNNRAENVMEPYQNPIISKYIGDLQNLSISPFNEIELETYFTDFDSPAYYALQDSCWRSHGITLDGLIVDDGTILCSSNSSDKVFEINSTGTTEIFLQDKELERITDMIQGSDGKIYAVQAPLFNENDNSIIIYPKRVISIENGVIKTEFELPSEINPNFSMNLEDVVPYWWMDGSFLHKLKIIENSEEGKKRFGNQYYISDLINDVIYKIDSEKKVSELARGLKYPSSIAVDSVGNVFYTTMPLSKGGPSLAHKVSLNVLNPETSEHALIYEFNESAYDYASYGGRAYLIYDGVKYITSVGFNITNVLYESKDKLEFLITNSLQGSLKYVTIEK